MSTIAEIRAQALAKGLTEHQANVAVVLVDLVLKTTKMIRLLGDQFSPHSDQHMTPFDQVIADTRSAARLALVNAVMPHLGIDLADGAAFSRAVYNLEGDHKPNIQIDLLIEICRTAPAERVAQ